MRLRIHADAKIRVRRQHDRSCFQPKHEGRMTECQLGVISLEAGEFRSMTCNLRGNWRRLDSNRADPSQYGSRNHDRKHTTTQGGSLTNRGEGASLATCKKTAECNWARLQQVEEARSEEAPPRIGIVSSIYLSHTSTRRRLCESAVDTSSPF
ncbi:hypothetical protein P153DRAFT_224081 [Dothidotthia symphoricarpi CBS 119687]|uniref:Uncharacterized protein n=1 Tax=Dothidotthia symphoricarpi CBS 119687 TaxID=1392245 RepID=A0A6A6AD90_9PLEO|nr:uncharacterized protein P153DRAFT_224081 [Dothidotthia symphoricarpi CBS 119687]KAF2129789.1 hypothetical protein P153DRAFT_224081 [Dothidotthia symphoricarpi CBS 119687]